MFVILSAAWSTPAIAISAERKDTHEEEYLRGRGSELQLLDSVGDEDDTMAGFLQALLCLAVAADTSSAFVQVGRTTTSTASFHQSSSSLPSTAVTEELHKQCTLDGKKIRGPITPLGNFVLVRTKDSLDATGRQVFAVKAANVSSANVKTQADRIPSHTQMEVFCCLTNQRRGPPRARSSPLDPGTSESLFFII